MTLRLTLDARELQAAEVGTRLGDDIVCLGEDRYPVLLFHFQIISKTVWSRE